MDVPPRFFLAAVPFGAYFIKLPVVPLITLEPTNVIEAPLLVHARSQRLDAQVKCDYLPRRLGFFLYRIDEGSIVVSPGVSTDRHFPVARWRRFSESGNHRWVGLVFLAAPASSRQQYRVAHDFDVHGWVAEGEKLMPETHAREAWLFACGHALEEGLHRLIQPEIDFRQQLAIHLIDFWVVLPAFSQRLLGVQAAPAFSSAQAHHPPVVEAATFALHKLQRRNVLLTDLQAYFPGEQHLLFLLPDSPGHDTGDTGCACSTVGWSGCDKLSRCPAGPSVARWQQNARSGEQTRGAHRVVQLPCIYFTIFVY